MRLLIVVAAVIAIAAASPLRGVMIKPGVSLIGLQPIMNIVIAEAREVYRSHGYPFVITSGLEGKHGVGSLHFVGLGIDFRVRDPGGDWSIPFRERNAMRDELRAAVGVQWDIVLKGGAVPHLHAEFQPKVGTNQA